MNNDLQNRTENIAEGIADAMMENPNPGNPTRETGALIWSSIKRKFLNHFSHDMDLDAGGCQSQSQGLGSCDDLSSGSSIDSSSQASGDAPLVSSFCIDAGFPFPD